MSFDIFFMPCRFGSEEVEQVDPATGEAQMVLPNEPLTVAEEEAVKHVLDQAGAGEPDEFGAYVVELMDGGSAEVYGDELSTGWMVALRGITPDVLRFLLDLLRAGNLVMIPAMENTAAVAISTEAFQSGLDDFDAVICNSTEELGAFLDGGFQAWKNYRDQVVGDNG